MLRSMNSPALAGRARFLSLDLLPGAAGAAIRETASRFVLVAVSGALMLSGMAAAQTDPGVQSGNRGTGAALSSVLAAKNIPSFKSGTSTIAELKSSVAPS